MKDTNSTPKELLVCVCITEDVVVDDGDGCRDTNRSMGAVTHSIGHNRTGIDDHAS